MFFFNKYNSNNNNKHSKHSHTQATINISKSHIISRSNIPDRTHKGWLSFGVPRSFAGTDCAQGVGTMLQSQAVRVSFMVASYRRPLRPQTDHS